MRCYSHSWITIKTEDSSLETKIQITLKMLKDKKKNSASCIMKH